MYEGQPQMHFNSHAHVERDAMWREVLTHAEISTHTLTWSVTQKLRNSVISIHISTHTLTWSVTCTQVITHEGGNFNSHAHVERDTMFLKVTATSGISTHTLTWSVTASPKSPR